MSARGGFSAAVEEVSGRKDTISVRHLFDTGTGRGHGGTLETGLTRNLSCPPSLRHNRAIPSIGPFIVGRHGKNTCSHDEKAPTRPPIGYRYVETG